MVEVPDEWKMSLLNPMLEDYYFTCEQLASIATSFTQRELREEAVLKVWQVAASGLPVCPRQPVRLARSAAAAGLQTVGLPCAQTRTDAYKAVQTGAGQVQTKISTLRSGTPSPASG
eukprot:358978-Chlamydomonas_euryale.AAC.3